MSDVARRAIEVRGMVQGVGFRPFVHGLATGLGLSGFVKNRTSGVLIEVEGSVADVQAFVHQLSTRPPPLAHITTLEWLPREPVGTGGFRIDSSEGDAAGETSPVFVSADIATCDECLRELFDPEDRRFGYPFLNCSHCGPRLTIITGAPYDRASTTMAGFPMCAACRREYDDPSNRRFHAQPTACARCGPRLRFHATGGDASGSAEARLGQQAPLAQEAPLAQAARALAAGQIVAIKGLGGYHLACRARDGQAVARLRARKQRDEKPFAVMVTDLAAARALCAIAPEEQRQLLSASRPIVLLRRLPDSGGLAAAVSPASPLLGVMLPYTPVHHLLLCAVGEPLVMTSGNESDGPMAFDDGEAREKLDGIADFFLAHDRPIHLRCDDSVVRVTDGVATTFRRSRGFSPAPQALGSPLAVPTLAVGGQGKAAFALGLGRHGFLGHHLGDLDHYEAWRAFQHAVGHYERLCRIRPVRLVHDWHPDYATTRYAARRAAEEGLETMAVQHHHAHVASCLAENGYDGPVIGVAFDGSGYGEEGETWGGEFLEGSLAEMRRVAHLAPVAMPGGEAAIREPWRMALAWLEAAGESVDALGGRIDPSVLRGVSSMVRRRVNCPPTTSVGRLFDAVASLAGGIDRVSFEGQAPMRLEALAEGQAPGGGYPFEVAAGPDPHEPPRPSLVVDVRPMIRAVAADVRAGRKAETMARRFHTALVAIVTDVCARLRQADGRLETVALSGGVFMNAILLRETQARLGAVGFRVLVHRQVPPNDGGLAFGQLAIAAARDAARGRG